MTTAYAADHASALADVRAAGAAVTFAVAAGTYDAATDTYSGSTASSVAGYAVRDQGDPRRYAALSLTQSEAPALFFVPSTLGELPTLGMTVTWGGTTYTVRDVAPLDLDGTAIAATVVVAR